MIHLPQGYLYCCSSSDPAAANTQRLARACPAAFSQQIDLQSTVNSRCLYLGLTGRTSSQCVVLSGLCYQSRRHIQYLSLPLHARLGSATAVSQPLPPPPLTLTARLQPSDGSGSGPGLPIPKGRPIWNLHRQGSPLRPSPDVAAATLDTDITTCQCLTLLCQIADVWLSTPRRYLVYEGGAHPARPDRPNPTQFTVMENQNPMSMTGHPRNRRAYEKRRAEKETEQKRAKQRDENRPLLAIAVHLASLQPSSLSSQAHIRPWLPLAYLDSACFRRPCLRLFKRRPQPLALSACKQRSPDFVLPARTLPPSSTHHSTL